MVDPDELEILEVTRESLRAIFANEPRVFTPWLARPENLTRLSRAIGVELEDMETETSTGIFRVDGVARRADDGSKVIVENQFGRSDHDHLGKAMTYLAATPDGEARTVVWISEQFADEHLAVLAWLNANTPEDVGFYAVTPQVIRIGGSPPALTFEVAERPNTVVKKTREASRKFGEMVGEKRRRYWPIFHETMCADPAFAQATTRKGGGLGFLELYPDAGFRDDPARRTVVVYMSAPTEGTDSIGIFVRAAQEEETRRLTSAFEAAEARGDIPPPDPEADFSTEESCRETAARHWAVAAPRLRLLTELTKNRPE